MSASLSIFVGIPGCGKSTAAQKLAGPGREIISTDDLREELTGDMSDQGLNRAVFFTVNKIAEALLRNNVSVIIDATNLRTDYREGLMEIAIRYGANPLAYRFDTSEDFELCQERNIARTRNVPEEIMRRFHTLFMECCSEEQLENEGWIVVYPPG